MAKTVLITGASRGIGAACALAFAGAGYNVAINYRQNHAAARDVFNKAAEMGTGAMLCPADVSDRGQVSEMITSVLRSFGRVDVLVNNAGIAGQGLFTDITPQQWEEMFAVNVTGTFNVTQAALPGMIERKSGSVINISSMWGVVGASCEVHYSAAKAAVIGMTKALAKEVGPSGIRVNCIAPGVIQTDMNSMHSPETLRVLKEDTPLMRLGTPEDVAALALYLAGEGAAFVTGQVICADGGFSL